MSSTDAWPTGLKPDEGTSIWSMGMLMAIKVHGRQSDGRFSVMEIRYPPDATAPLHVHRKESEINYVLEGAVRYQIGDDVHDVGEGGMVHLPQGDGHGFRVGPKGARLLEVAVPAGLETLYERLGEPAVELALPTADPDIEGWLELAPEYGLELIGAPPE